MSSFRLLLAPALVIPLSGCPEDEEILTHGYVKLEMRRGESQATNPFVGTASVIATMDYDDCLKGFYDANPSLTQDGPEGAKVFGTREDGGEGWADRLCEDGQESSQASCTITELEQQLEKVKQLTITYNITDELENHVLLFGPLPTKATAKCADPIVKVSANGAIKGRNGDGDTVWETESFSPNAAVTGQGGEIVVKASRVE